MLKIRKRNLIGVIPIILGTLLHNKSYDINIKDTYYIVSYLYIGVFISILYFLFVIFLRKKTQ